MFVISIKNAFYASHITNHFLLCTTLAIYRKEITYTLQPRFCKVDYRPVNVQCPNSTQDNTILMMILEAVM